MSHPRRVYNPVRLEVLEDGEHDGLYEIHLGRPGKPRVYSMVGKFGIRRVGDPETLLAVSRAYAKRMEALRKLKAMQDERKASRLYRWRIQLGVWWARVVEWMESTFTMKPIPDEESSDSCETIH